jgi:hypothetical protein
VVDGKGRSEIGMGLEKAGRVAYWDPEGHQAYKLAVFNNGHSIIINSWAARVTRQSNMKGEK